MSQLKSYPKRVDLDNCESEPIHLITKIQCHGFLLVLNTQLQILQVSNSCNTLIGVSSEELLKMNVSQLLHDKSMERLQEWLKDPVPHIPFEAYIDEKAFLCIPHMQQGYLLLDFEPFEEKWDALLFQQEMLSVLRRLSNTTSVAALTDKAAQLIKELLHYDRVMIYQFDHNWNGNIVSEAKQEHLASWKGLQYPAGDIPEQARKLFLKQGVRILSSIDEEYASLIPAANPDTGFLTNVGQSHLRGSSAIHIEYLQNMKVGATLNCAIVNNGKLWGLISCHHYAPKFIDFRKRQSCQLLAEMLSTQLAQKNTEAYLDHANKLAKTRSILVENMSKRWDIIAGLTAYPIKAMDMLDCSGFVVSYNNEVVTTGNVPTKSHIQQILKELDKKDLIKNGVFETNCLITILPWTCDIANDASGMLLCKLSNKEDEALIWFREERIKSVTWGGKPTKITKQDDVRLSPRKSFEKWTEEVKCTSMPWLAHEISGATVLADDIKNIIVTKFSEIAQLNKRLVNLNQELESFSYSVSHDLRGPLRGIDGFAQILMEDYAEVLDEHGRESLSIIIKSAEKMNTLMDDILSYSGMNQIDRHNQAVDINVLIDEIEKQHHFKNDYPNAQLNIQKNLPLIHGDKAMIYQLFANLLTNAFKYSAKTDTPIIEVSCDTSSKNNVYSIKDNGIGFDSKYASKIFGIFTRLWKSEYKGTGVGLAIAQRVVLKHEGEIWATAAPDKGAIFYFYIPS